MTGSDSMHKERVERERESALGNQKRIGEKNQ